MGTKHAGQARPTGRVDGSVLPVGLLLHPFEVGIALVSIIVTAGFVISAIFMGNVGASLLQTVLNPPWLWLWGACMAGGGLAVLGAIFTLAKSRLQWEVAGWALMSTAWAVYAVAVFSEATRNSLVPGTFASMITLFAVFRIRALFISARVAVRATGSPQTHRE